MRIAVVLEERCQPDRCSYECINYCPKVRTGHETIVKTEDGNGIKINEEICAGCGICVDKCPFDAIKIINLPEELDTDLIHQFGENTFRLYRLPLPEKGLVTGLLGANAIGKTTAVRILSGEIVPNFGRYEEDASWKKAVEEYSGTALGDYFKDISKKSIVTALKPQYVDKIPAHYSGMVEDLLAGVGDDYERWVEMLDIEDTLRSKVTNLSGGELQRVAIAATTTKDADVYFYDEPSSYLDIKQRLKAAEVIRKKSEENRVVVIEHDLAVLDFLADNVHVLYGSKGAYGIVSHPKGVRKAINSYLHGFLEEENVRFRETEITFEKRAPKSQWHSKPIVEYNRLIKEWDDFVLETEKGEIPEGEVVGIVGPNATGKTTFVKMLADVIQPTEGEIKKEIDVSYKPQYIKPSFDGRVIDLYRTEINRSINNGFFQSNVLTPLNIQDLYERDVANLSGGELQRVVITLCLGREADLYLIDEPSAYLDAGRRMTTAKVIRRFMEKTNKGGMIVDHDVYFIDYVSDLIMNFSGVPSKKGKGEGPYDMRSGMNNFLKDVNITFRRDEETHRPRVNKLESRLDKKQKSRGEYYYLK